MTIEMERNPIPTGSLLPNFGNQHEAVGIFESYGALEATVDELLTSGFARCELSLGAQQEGEQAHESAEILADDPAARRTNHFCTEALGNAEGALIGGFAILPALGTALGAAAAGASIAVTAAAVVASGGTAALIGAGLAALVVHNRNRGFKAQQEQGGLLLWVATRSPELQQRALDILRRHAAHHVHSHDLALA
jgi:hypothetical protein